MRAASTLEITSGEQRTLCKFSASWNLSSGLKIARLHKRNVSGRVTLLPGSELRPVSFNKRQKSEEAFFQKHSWRVHVSPMFPTRKTLFPVSVFCFQDANYAYATRQGILTKIRAREHLQKFCEQLEQRPNFARTFNLDGTIRYP